MSKTAEAASKREVRFANGRGNLFRSRFAATHGTCGFVNGRPVNSGETIHRRAFIILTIVHFTFISICAKVINDFY